MSRTDKRNAEEKVISVAAVQPSKMRQVAESRKVWAGGLGLVVTLALWGLGEIDGARAVEAMTWVLGVFIGAVALEDGMTRFFGTLIHTPNNEETGED